MKAEGSLSLSQEPHHLSSSQNKWIQSTPRHCIQSISSTFILIFPPIFAFSFQMRCFFQGFLLNSPPISLLNRTCHMPHPSHLPLFHHHNYMCWGIKFMNSSWLKLFELPFTSSVLGPNFLLNTREIIFSSLSDGDQSQSVKIKNFLYSHIRLSVMFILHVEGFRGLRPKETGSTYTIKAAILWGDTVQKQVRRLHNFKICTSPGANVTLVSAQRKVKICGHTTLKNGLFLPSYWNSVLFLADPINKNETIKKQEHCRFVAYVGNFFLGNVTCINVTAVWEERWIWHFLESKCGIIV